MKTLAIGANLIALAIIFLALKKYGFSDGDAIYAELAALLAPIISLIALIRSYSLDDLLILYIQRKKIEQQKAINDLEGK